MADPGPMAKAAAQIMAAATTLPEWVAAWLTPCCLGKSSLPTVAMVSAVMEGPPSAPPVATTICAAMIGHNPCTTNIANVPPMIIRQVIAQHHPRPAEPVDQRAGRRCHQHAGDQARGEHEPDLVRRPFLRLGQPGGQEGAHPAADIGHEEIDDWQADARRHHRIALCFTPVPVSVSLRVSDDLVEVDLRPRRRRVTSAGCHPFAPVGSQMVNVAPSPSRLSMASWPRCRLTMCLTMARPSPVPPMARERPVSTR